ncbi:AAA family ATPase [Nocardia terpenica]|nr:AAA family ATPase [Nocardia terpenica]MBF6102515.1 AAA family ATPase [Nocardia terpenica]MBF6111294.1 AAA family ATPase [Nocardia terpenica]MBF6117425.1 AAA family ATPase [Nocardia terpenica]MBF6150734.1 AAA family ATPase [Nocardia terpenica]
MKSTVLRSPLRGRAQEMDRIHRALEFGRRGGCSLVVVEGVPGSGKTRLLDDCVAAAAPQGFDISPGLVMTEPDLPTLVVIDDAHNYGERSRDTILSQRYGRYHSQTVWLLARRSYSGARDLDALVASSTGYSDTIVLDSLAPAATTELAGDLLGAPPSPALAEVIARAEGNPGLVTELLVGMQEENSLLVGEFEAELVADRLPRRLVDHVESLLLGYSDQCRQLLRVAAVLGRQVSVGTLAPMLAISPSALLSLLDEAVATGALECGGGDRVQFRNELLWRIIVTSIPTPLRRALRRQATDITESAGDDGAHDPANTVATPEHSTIRGFNEQESAIIRLVQQGLTNRQIARSLLISPHTVNYHLKKLFRKVGVNSRVALLAAVRHRDA